MVDCRKCKHTEKTIKSANPHIPFIKHEKIICKNSNSSKYGKVVFEYCPQDNKVFKNDQPEFCSLFEEK